MNKPLMKEFKLEVLFDVVNKTHMEKEFLKEKIKSKEYSLPATSAGTSNNMISYYVRLEEHKAIENCISVTANGQGYSVYQPKPFAIAQDSYALFLKNKKHSNQYVYIYLNTHLQKILQKYNYQNKSGWQKVKKEIVNLPVKSLKDIEPDYEYMNSYVDSIYCNQSEKLMIFLKKNN